MSFGLAWGKTTALSGIMGYCRKCSRGGQSTWIACARKIRHTCIEPLLNLLFPLEKWGGQQRTHPEDAD
ncbi:hypothetical protein CEXT_212721 [Caerostris extrusa]|uniref:Uncharacterized protein n=1 Tax=Caerostris extrusa TaxID=172846 RepID=A0AAV4QHK6_CAEEX|nr:hypothetical protein CEXT_212721 [Caerostris extrusa]